MNNHLWDTHSHIYKEYYEDTDEIVRRATEKNVKYIINSGVDQSSNEEVIDFCKNKDNVYCTIGIHPENVKNYTLEHIDFIEKNLNNKKVLAIGEIGLDYHYETENRKEQLELFELQLKLAEKLNVPVVIHSRDATKDTIDCLKKFKVRGVIHSFSGSLETANEYIKMGFLLGVNGVITFKNCNMKDVYKNIEIKNIVLETDSPYLSPVPLRGRTNEPQNIVIIAEFLKDVYGISFDQVTKITTTNVEQIFDISK